MDAGRAGGRIVTAIWTASLHSAHGAGKGTIFVDQEASSLELLPWSEADRDPVAFSLPTAGLEDVDLRNNRFNPSLALGGRQAHGKPHHEGVQGVPRSLRPGLRRGSTF